MRTKSLILGVAVCLLGGVASAQFGREAPVPSGAPPEAEFHMARLAYRYNSGCAGSRGYCNPWWAIDYPYAEAHFLPAVKRMTRIEVAPDSRQRDARRRLLSSTIRGCSCSNRGRAIGSRRARSSMRLREYLERGGFLVVDDFHGEYEWAAFREAIDAILPGRADRRHPRLRHAAPHPVRSRQAHADPRRAASRLGTDGRASLIGAASTTITAD